jgi:hypothetical protein
LHVRVALVRQRVEGGGILCQVLQIVRGLLLLLLLLLVMVVEVVVVLLRAGRCGRRERRLRRLGGLRRVRHVEALVLLLERRLHLLLLNSRLLALIGLGLQSAVLLRGATVSPTSERRGRNQPTRRGAAAAATHVCDIDEGASWGACLRSVREALAAPDGVALHGDELRHGLRANGSLNGVPARAPGYRARMKASNEHG